MNAFLDRWANVVADNSDTAQQAKQKPDPEMELLHYLLIGKSVFDEMTVERCEVGCGGLVNFYKHEGVLYGYCARCEVYQQIQNL